jgi:hypothetical protein
LSEKQVPQVVVNVANSKHRMERLEWLGVLAKQVLSQLSYTPTSESFYSKAFLKPLHRSLAGGLTNAPVAAPGRGDC